LSRRDVIATIDFVSGIILTISFNVMPAEAGMTAFFPLKSLSKYHSGLSPIVFPLFLSAAILDCVDT
jgi:hypothetical protein